MISLWMIYEHFVNYTFFISDILIAQMVIEKALFIYIYNKQTEWRYTWKK